jgi:glyoxylase-like metal-dependent hydrolase (beta-lactamase superfamily II)
MGYPGIYTIRGVMGVCHLLVDDDGAVLLDTGLVGEPWLIQWRLQRLGLKPHDVKAILLTHGHIDHAGATAQLARQRSLPIEGPHREEAFWIDQLPAQSQRFGFPPSEAFTPDRWLEHGDTVTVGNETLQVLHTPGHTPGHVAFFHAPSRVAIVGDVLFQGSIGRTDFPRGDFETLVRSIRERLWPLGNDVTFIPGHGPVSTFGRERATNPYVGDGASPKHL